MDEWLTTKEVMILCDWNDRRQVNRAAKRERWRARASHSQHSENHYRREDVQDFLRCRKRTKLVGQWRYGEGSKQIRRLLRDARYDAVCPVCKEYAVFGHRCQ